MYNWDDPINDALSKPDIVPEKKVSSELNKNFTDSASADIQDFPAFEDSGVGSTGMEDIEPVSYTHLTLPTKVEV